MPDSANGVQPSSRVALASIPAAQWSNQTQPGFTMPPAPQAVNTGSILAHAGTYGEAVDPALACAFNLPPQAPSDDARMPGHVRRSATAARQTIKQAVLSPDDDELDFAVTKVSGADKKSRLLYVANNCSFGSPPCDEDLKQMQLIPLRIVAEKLKIQGQQPVSCSLSLAVLDALPLLTL